MVVALKTKKSRAIKSGPANDEIDPNDQSNESPKLKDFEYNSKHEIPEEETIISIGGKKVGTIGNAVVITGKPKSRKSVIAQSIIGAAISGSNILGIESHLTDPTDHVAYIDTEQSIHDLKRSIDRTLRLAGKKDLPKNFKCYMVRTFTPEQIRKGIIELCENPKTRLIVIDGGLDLINNMNDIEETKEVIQFTKNILEKYRVCLVFVIHQSKSTNFTIGHFGSFMDRFAQSLIEVVKNESGSSEVKPALMRSDANFVPYEFHWNYDTENYSISHLEPAEVSLKNPEDMMPFKHEEKLKQIFKKDAEITYKEFLKRSANEYSKSEYWCKKLTKHLFDINLLFESANGLTMNQNDKPPF